MEVTTPGVGDHVDVFYNVSDDYQEFIFWWTGNNSLIQNNTIIRDRVNPSLVNTVFTMAPGLGKFTVQNNIFVVAHGLQVWVSTAYGQNNYGSVLRQNNVYYCTDGSVADPCGAPLGINETLANPQFVDFSGRDFHLTDGSPAINAGLSLGYRSDSKIIHWSARRISELLNSNLRQPPIRSSSAFNDHPLTMLKHQKV